MPTDITVQPEFSRLMSLLNNTRVQTQNPALWQFLRQFVESTKQFQGVTNKDVEDLSEDLSGINEILEKIIESTILTVEDETEAFTASRRLVAGINVTFDDSVAGIRTINATAGAPAGSTLVVREIPTGTINGVNAVFTLTNTPIIGSEQVFLNGLLQDARGMDYSISGAVITYLIPPLVGDRILVTYQR
jgi:hypothetical protein